MALFIEVRAGVSSRVDTVKGSDPLLSTNIWDIALPIALIPADLDVSFASLNCLPGLMATIVIESKMPTIPITTKSSMRVKPLRFCNIGV